MRLVVAVAVVVAGCAAPGPTPEVSAPVSAAGDGAEPATDDWRVTLLADDTSHSGASYYLGPGEAVWGVFGRLRASYVDGAATVASSFPATNIGLAAQADPTAVDSPWYFRTGAGQLYWAPDFTGDLSRVEGPGHCVALDASGGVAYCLAVDGRLWVSSRDEPQSMRPVVGDVADVGAVPDGVYLVRKDGRVEMIRTGGTPTKVDSQGKCATRIATVNDRVFIVVGDAWQERGTDGTFRPSPTPREVWATESGGYSTHDERDTAFRRDLAKAFAKRYRVSSTLRPPQPKTDPLPGKNCEIYGVPEGGFTLCADDSGLIPVDSGGTRTLFERTSEGWRARPPEVEFLGFPFESAIGDDRDLVFVGYCGVNEDVEEDTEVEIPVCWVSRTERTSWSVKRPPSGDVELDTDRDPDDFEHQSPLELDALDNGWLLVRLAGAVQLYDLAQGPKPQPLWSRSIPGRRVWGPVLQSGEVQAVFEHKGERSLARAKFGERATLSPLPRGATRVASANPRRWIAVGETMAEVWVSTDGGDTWRAQQPKIDGDPAQVPIAAPKCTGEQCVARPVLWASPKAVEGYVPPTWIGPLTDGPGHQPWTPVKCPPSPPGSSRSRR